jgi:hypothetical protein
MPAQWIVFIILFMLADLALAFLIIRFAVRRCWGPLPERYPESDPAPDAVTRNFQTFRVGLVNLGWCVHVSVDDEFLHLRPASFIRKLGGKGMSIPWDRVFVKKSAGSRATAIVDSLAIDGPSWCLELADPPDSSDAGR